MPQNYQLAYTEIDGAWHEIDAANEDYTVCGLALPYPGAQWTRELPDEVHCGENKTKKAKPVVEVKVTKEVPVEATPSKAKAKK